MRYRRRQRWLRRMALGFAFATVVVAGTAAPASAGLDEGVGSRSVITQSSSAAADRPPAEPFVPGVTDFPRRAVVHQQETAGDGTTVEWGNTLALAGALVLAFALGLWLGVIRRPSVAGH